VLSTSFHLNHSPVLPIAEHIDYKTWGVIQQREYESWVKNIEEIKQLLEFRQRTNTAFKGNAFSRFPNLLGSAEAQVIWCGIVKCLLIVYFIGNISAEKISKLFTCVKDIASQRRDVFSRHGVDVAVMLHRMLTADRLEWLSVVVNVFSEIFIVCTLGSLRSSNASHPTVPTTRTELVYHAFSVVGLTTWNALPATIQLCICVWTFNIDMKMQLVTMAYLLCLIASVSALWDFVALYKSYYCIVLCLVDSFDSHSGVSCLILLVYLSVNRCIHVLLHHFVSVSTSPVRAPGP